MSTQTIVLTVEGLKIAGTCHLPNTPPPHPAILLTHGWSSSQQANAELADMLARRGFLAFTYDLQGHGESEGDLDEVTRADFLRTTIAAYDTLVDLGSVDPGAIYATGSSLGAYLTALLAGERALKALSLRVPANAPDDLMDKPGTLFDDLQAKAWRAHHHGPNDARSLQAIHAFAGDVLVIEAGRDEAIPHETVQSYCDALSDRRQLTYVLVGGATHVISSDPRMGHQVNAMAAAWFATR